MKRYLFLFLVAFFLFPVASQAAKFSFSAGQDFEQSCPAQIDILVDPQGVLTNGADAFIKYNPSQIVVDAVTKGDAYEVYLTPVIDNVNGLIKYSAFSLFSSLNKSAVFGHIRFHSQPGVTNTKFDWLYSAGSTTDSNIARTVDSQDILSEMPLPQAYGFYASDGYCDEDKIPPTIDNEVPTPGSVNNPLDSSVSFIFRDDRSGVDINSVSVKIANNGITTEYKSGDFDYALIEKSPRGEPRAYSILINPNPTFVSRKAVTVSVSGKDLAGNVGGGSWSFNHPEVTCEDLGCTGGEPTVCAQNLSLLATPGNKQVSLEWLPTLSTLGFDKILINRLECSTTLQFPTPSSGQKVYDSSGYSYVDNNLVNGTQYCYSAYAYRGAGSSVEYSSGAFARATPNCYMQPITDLSVVAKDGGTMLSWKNPHVDNLGSIKIIRKENGCPNRWLPDGWEGNKVVYDGVGESFFDTSAFSGKDFCYLAFAHSDDGCLSPGILKSTSQNYTTSTDGFTPDYHYYTNSGILELTPSNNNLELLLNKDLTIVTNSKFLKPVENVVAEIGDNAYSLIYNEQLGQYSLHLENFDTVGTQKGDLMVIYTDQTYQYTLLNITVDPLGFVKDAVLRKNISGAEVSLVDSAGTIFVGANQKNPLITAEDGLYGFMVPNGRYRIVVRSNGQERYRGGIINVNNNIVNQEILLSPVNWGGLWDSLMKALKNPKLQKANKYGALAVGALAVLNAIASIPWWNFWYYLQYLFTEFIPWLFRRKRKGWGVVYNSITKAPIDLAIVRLYNASSKKLLQSKITDKQGRYVFLVEAGSYYLEVYKPGFDFPSELLKSAKEDRRYSDIYHGEVITIKDGEKGAIIANIPMDQHELKDSDKKIYRDQFWQAVKNNVSYVGPIFAIAALIISPGWLMAGLTALHIVLFLLFRRLAKGKKPRSWGIVYDTKNGKALPKSIARIFSPEYNRMLEAYVTDRYGRYGFLAGNNVYYVTAEKEGYQTYKTENIDLSNGEVQVVGKNMPLSPLGSGLNQAPIAEAEPAVRANEPQDYRDIFKGAEQSPTEPNPIEKPPVNDNLPQEDKKPKEGIWG